MSDGIVFDGAHLRVVVAGPPPGEVRGLMVTYDVRSAGKTDFGSLLRSSNFRKAGFAQMSIRTTANDWFVNPDTVALEAALPALTAPYAVVRALGYSMGGYGALRFAVATRAQSVVLVAPQWSIHPDVAPFDWRYRAEGRQFNRALGDLAGRVPASLRGLILYDPFVTPDARHARLVQQALPGIRGVRLAFGGHPPVRVLGQSGKSGLVMLAATAQGAPGGAILAAHRAGRRGNEGYWTRLARQAAPRRPALAATAQAEAARLRGDRPQERVDGATESP